LFSILKGEWKGEDLLYILEIPINYHLEFQVDFLLS